MSVVEGNQSLVCQKVVVRRRRIAIHGLPYFCAKLSAILVDPAWSISDHSYTAAGLVRFIADLWRCDLAFMWGGRISMGKFLRTARYFRKQKVIVLWCGSDVLYAQEELASGKMDSWVAERMHWAASPILAEEVRAMGLRCEYVQVSFAQPVPRPAELPRKFSVLVYVPTLERARLYGLDTVLEVAEALPNVDFTVVGLREGETVNGPRNLKTHRRVDDLGTFIDGATAIWRPVRHDAGTSFMVLEALARGRHVLYTYPFPACIEVTTADAARREIERLMILHYSDQLSLNDAGIRTIVEEYSPERVRANLFRRWAEIIDSDGDPLRVESMPGDHGVGLPDAEGTSEQARVQGAFQQQASEHQLNRSRLYKGASGVPR